MITRVTYQKCKHRVPWLPNDALCASVIQYSKVPTLSVTLKGLLHIGIVNLAVCGKDTESLGTKMRSLGHKKYTMGCGVPIYLNIFFAYGPFVHFVPLLKSRWGSVGSQPLKHLKRFSLFCSVLYDMSRLGRCENVMIYFWI